MPFPRDMNAILGRSGNVSTTGILNQAERNKSKASSRAALPIAGLTSLQAVYTVEYASSSLTADWGSLTGCYIVTDVVDGIAPVVAGWWELKMAWTFDAAAGDEFTVDLGSVFTVGATCTTPTSGPAKATLPWGGPLGGAGIFAGIQGPSTDWTATGRLTGRLAQKVSIS